MGFDKVFKSLNQKNAEVTKLISDMETEAAEIES